MKNQVLTSIIAIGFSALIANTPAVAQTNCRANIPFSFVAGGTEYPSGTYEISRMSASQVVKMTNVSTGAGHLVSAPVPVGGSSASPKLVFQTTADGYRLSEVWLQGVPGMKTLNSSKSSEAASVKVAIR